MIDKQSQIVFQEIKPLGKRESEVYFAIKELFECTDQQISNFLALPINCVTPRRNRLAEIGLVYCSSIKPNYEGRKVNHWKVTNIVLNKGEFDDRN